MSANGGYIEYESEPIWGTITIKEIGFNASIDQQYFYCIKLNAGQGIGAGTVYPGDVPIFTATPPYRTRYEHWGRRFRMTRLGTFRSQGHTLHIRLQNNGGTDATVQFYCNVEIIREE